MQFARLETRIFLAILSMAAIGCAGVNFGSVDKQTASSADSTSTTGGDASGQLTQGANPTPALPPPVPPPLVNVAVPMPKVKFVGPPCIRGTACLVEFDLDQASTEPFQFDWHTNDTLYLQAGAPTGYVYGKPGVHYVSTSGQIVFAPGDTVKQVYVQNINPYNIQIIIGVNMTNCTFNGNLGDCADFFN